MPSVEDGNDGGLIEIPVSSIPLVSDGSDSDDDDPPRRARSVPAFSALLRSRRPKGLPLTQTMRFIRQLARRDRELQGCCCQYPLKHIHNRKLVQARVRRSRQGTWERYVVVCGWITEGQLLNEVNLDALEEGKKPFHDSNLGTWRPSAREEFVTDG
jgi:hypothetical protein